MRQPAVVTDTGSTKRDDRRGGARRCRRGSRSSAAIRSAGAAQGGLEHARPDLFAGRPWLLTPTGERRRRRRVEKLSAFVRALGARAARDRRRRRTIGCSRSQPPAAADGERADAGGRRRGRRRTAWRWPAAASPTRRGSPSSPPDIWRDIAATNADEIGPALDALIALLQDLRADLPEGDRLADVFTDAAGGETARRNQQAVIRNPNPRIRNLRYPCVAAGISVTTVERSAGKYFLNTSCSTCGVTASMRCAARQDLARVAAVGLDRLQPAQPVVVLLQRRLVAAPRRFLGAIGQVRGRPFLLQPLDLLHHARGHRLDVLRRRAEAHLDVAARRAAAAPATGRPTRCRSGRDPRAGCRAARCRAPSSRR